MNPYNYSPFEIMAASAYVVLWQLLEEAGQVPSNIKPSPSFAFDADNRSFPNPSVIDAVNRSLPKGSARDNFIAAFAPYSKPKLKPR